MNFLRAFFFWVIGHLNSFLMLFGFRWRQNRWGVVYDSVSKQPLDPAQVKLVDALTGKVVQSSVTDINGRYGFLATPGKFKIFVSKTNYFFPSKKARGDRDGIYDNLYRGEFFELLGDSGVICFNIPMDPLREDWNQQAKQRLVKISAFGEILALRVTSVLFWVVFVLALAGAYRSPSNFVYGLLGFYLAVFLLALFLPKPRLWGKLYERKSGCPLVGANIELVHEKFPDIVAAKGMSLNDGRFFLRAQAGTYLAKISIENESGQKRLLTEKKIRIKGSGYFNRDIVV